MDDFTKQLAKETRDRIARDNPEHFPLMELLDALAVLAHADEWSPDIDRQSLAALMESGLRSDAVDEALEQFVERLGIEVDGIELMWVTRGLIRVMWGREPATMDRFWLNMPGPVRERMKVLAAAYVAKLETELTE
jgi:hypothetical protein